LRESPKGAIVPTNIVVPELGESVVEATVGHWRKKEGDQIGVGDVLVELETEKVDLEVGAEHSGVLARIARKEGENVKIGDLLGVIEEAPAEQAVPPESRAAAPTQAEHAPPPAARAEPRSISAEVAPADVEEIPSKRLVTPLAKRLAEERGVDLSKVQSSDSQGRIRQRDVESYLEGDGAEAATLPARKEESETRGRELREQPPRPASIGLPREGERPEERVRMSRRRLTIARRLVEAQHTAAMLTTFNEIDMSAVMALRARWKETFKQEHGVGLGITSFFVKASIDALRQFPRLNAEIQGADMVLKRYYDIGVAVGAPGGLVVPVLRDADHMGFAEIEKAIKEFARQAEARQLTLEDLRGGTFTISNGGVYGSLLSTPILNPPQVGILGLHKIENRAVPVEGQIQIRPMMYVALSYDHRIVDGMEAVQFLVRIKEMIEDPAGLLFSV
jgi:2-oxoglutarate dehydrogenase E2 component (dihydrolipoamide succinyltransferase)